MMTKNFKLRFYLIKLKIYKHDLINSKQKLTIISTIIKFVLVLEFINIYKVEF